MNKLKYLSFAIAVMFVFTACENNDAQKFLEKDTFVCFPESSASIDENDEGSLSIPLILAGVPGGVSVSVTLEISTEGCAVPAIEGVDFTINKKDFVFEGGYGTQDVVITPIDNDVFTGKKTFNIIISQTSPTLMESVQNSVTVTIVDDEHPWAAIIGNYTMTAKSYYWEAGDPEYETMPVRITASDEDIDILLAYIGSAPLYGNPALMKVEEADGEIYVSIADEQYIGVMPKPQGSWNRYFRATSGDVLWTDGGSVYFQNAMVGIFENNVITFENGWGIQAIHPSTGASGGFFDIFLNGVTFTKQ